MVYAWKPHVSPTLAYWNQYRHYFSGDFQDSISHLGQFSLPYSYNQRTTFIPSYSYRYTNFVGSSPPDSSGDKIFVHTPSLGISHAFTPSIRGVFRVGVAFLKEKGSTEFVGGTQTDLSDKWQTNGVGSVELVKTYPKGSFGVEASQNVGSGGGATAGGTLSQVITGSINHKFSARLSASGSLGYAWNNSTEGDSLDTNTYIIQAGLQYTFLRWLKGDLGYSHIEQRSKGSAANDLGADTVYVTLTAIADPWVWLR